MDPGFIASLLNAVTAVAATAALAIGFVNRLINRRTAQDAKHAAVQAAAAAVSAEQTKQATVLAVQEAHRSTNDAVEGSRQRTAEAVEGSRQATVYSAEQTTQALTFLAEQMADMWLEVQERIDHHGHRNDVVLAAMLHTLQTDPRHRQAAPTNPTEGDHP